MKRENWQVPEFVIHRQQERKNPYCLVIPVINEGERIRHQLRKTHELGIHKKVDTIIVDGGSTDGSLESSFLDSVGVQHLITRHSCRGIGQSRRRSEHRHRISSSQAQRVTNSA